MKTVSYWWIAKTKRFKNTKLKLSANSNEVRSAHTHTLSLSPFQLAMNGLSRLNYKVPK